MNNGIGIDIVEIEEMRAHWSDLFVSRILSPQERTVYDTMGSDKRRLEYLAGRFAAKEAYTKAYGSFDEPLNFNEVSVLNDASGKPRLQSPYRQDDSVLISLSHSRHFVVAMCHIEKNGA